MGSICTQIESILHLLCRLSETPGGSPAVLATHLLVVALWELLEARTFWELLEARALLQSRLHHRFPNMDPEKPMIGQKATSLDKPIYTIRILRKYNYQNTQFLLL